MEVEFRIRKKKTQEPPDKATNILLIKGIKDWKAATRPTFVRGTIAFVKRNRNCGFICSSDGQGYCFNGSDLRGGLIFKNLRQRMEVEFQIRRTAEGNRAPEAMNVRLIQVNRSAGVSPTLQNASSRGVVSLTKQDRKCGYIHAPNGSVYRFHESDIAEEIGYWKLRNGMEVQFYILTEAKPGKTGKAINVRPAKDGDSEPIPVQVGVVYRLVPKLRCGFISMKNGKEYQFTAADLIGGLKYEDVRENTEVTFQIGKGPGKKAGKAVNVRLARK